MNKKTKKYFFWVAAGLTIIVVSLFLFVAISVKINGRYKIEIITVNERNVDYKINAEGVFGSISEFQSDNGILYLEGYYKNIDIVIDDVKIEEIQSLVILDKKNVLKLSVEEFESDIQGKSLILKTNNSFNQKKNFFRKSSEIIAFELAKPIFIDIVLSLGFFCILISLFLLIKKIRKYDKTKMKSFSKSGLTSIGVFFLGFVFWLIVVLVLLEITLRIIGFAFNNAEAETKISNDDGKFVVLCIGDSFTYGVGSTNGNDYPAHLQKLLQENTNKEVIVVNRGRCAQNSSQVIEKLQEDLNSCQPNLVIMLFGMANSWNYYGFQILDNYWEKIRIVKLFKRISYNLKYKGASTDTNQNVKDYALSFLIKSFEFPRFGTDADKYYYYVGRYYLALRNWENSFRYLSFALSKNQSNINCFEALKVCLREYDNEKHYNSDLGLIDTTVIAESIAKLDSLISKYPDVHAIRTLKELYLFEKEHSKIT
ncbi:MAG: SGNH/GDSL hydrolase family protein, partial [Bacteroidales bacterium]|nr:SGNH/GDSL hydrolase family protein [Bacteroidales bacterium]